MVRRSWAIGLVLLLGIAATGGIVSCGDGARTLEAGDGPLVYVPMGNSLTFWPRPDGMIYLYRDTLETDLGVTVDFRDHTVGGETSEGMLRRFRTDEQLRTDLAEADVVTLLIPNDEWTEPVMTVMGIGGRDPADCGGDDHQQCLRDVLDEYRANTDAIFAELMALCDPAEVLIRAQDFWNFKASEQVAAGTLAITNPYWRDANEHVAEVAGSYGIPVAQTNDEFMGPDGTDPPEERGLLGADHLHPTAAGAQLLVEMIHDLGYELAG
jgi:lysophospholipase L1-like esterase